MLTLNRSFLTIVTILDERERGEGRFFLADRTLGSKKVISIVPRTSTYPRMDIIPSNSADRASQASLTTFLAKTSFPLPTDTAISPTMLYQRNLTVILGVLITVSSTCFHSFRVPLPWSYQHLVGRFFKDAGHAHKKVDL